MLSNPETLSTIVDSVVISFEIAAIVTVIDFLAGLPIAWILVRKEFRGKEFLDTLIDMPLAVPTAALGFSAAVFWVMNPTQYLSLFCNILSLSSDNPSAHRVLYPYMVRSLAAILER